MRGVTTRGMYDDGDQERELSAKYEVWQSTASFWPRTSALLGTLAESWKRDTGDHDVDAEWSCHGLVPVSFEQCLL